MTWRFYFFLVHHVNITNSNHVAYELGGQMKRKRVAMRQRLGGKGQALMQVTTKLPWGISYKNKYIFSPITSITSNKIQNEVTLRILCTY